MGSIAAGLVAGLGVFASSCLIWLRLAFAYHARAEETERLEEASTEPPAGGWPTLAVIFAARNEEEAVGPAARSMLAQDYPGISVVAVDDRSTDRTGAILDAIADEDPRLHVLHIRDLPDGWLGKNHALQTAAESVATSATWLLFTDGDVVFEPSTLRRAVALAEREGLDHLVATPNARTESEPERAFMAMFCLMFILYAPPWKVRQRRSKAAMGVGAFNLVRTEAFQAVGGFRRLALSIDEDMRLGRALKFAGYRAAVVQGHRLISLRWHHGLRGMIRGLEKNFYAGIEFRFGRMILGVCSLLVVGVAPFAGLVVGPWWSRLICVLGIIAGASVLAGTRGQNGLAWYHIFALPLGAVASAIALVRSTWLTLRRRGVVWREHFYPLAALREHVRRREAWLQEVWRSTR
jgi:glycosyltransferase involved in cell wall biosynthesis